jgi:hypothetical protein
MSKDREREKAATLLASVERLPFASAVALLDEEIARVPDPASWLINASLAESLPALLGVLEEATGDVVEARINASRRTVAQLAFDVISGTISPILGARAIVGLRHRVGLAEDDEDFNCIIGIESETDTLPVGSVREHWVPRILTRKGAEIREAEKWALRVGATAFESIWRRWGAG